MEKKRLLVWAAANALGLGLMFLATLQATMLIEFGLDFERHWDFIPPDADLRTYLARLGGAVVGGLVFGTAQALALRSRGIRALPWILATTAGFVLLLLIAEWPLMAAGLWGRIPGPVEPIVLAVGSCGLAAVFQQLMLRRRGPVAWTWLALWVGGLVVALLPTALVFLSLQRLGVPLNWPAEAFLSGFVPAGIAALLSGRAFFAAIDGSRQQEDGPIAKGAAARVHSAQSAPASQ